MKLEYELSQQKKDDEISDLKLKLEDQTAKLEQLGKKLAQEQILRSEAQDRSEIKALHYRNRPSTALQKTDRSYSSSQTRAGKKTRNHRASVTS